jgi:hypothetical protein
VLGSAEACEVGADLGHQRLSDGAPDTGDGVQPRKSLLIRVHALSDLGTHLGKPLVEEVDVGQLLCH